MCGGWAATSALNPLQLRRNEKCYSCVLAGRAVWRVQRPGVRVQRLDVQPETKGP